ncbi:D,D-heptose 1,7-bisphosphate phosphatase [Candidatus Blochmanniella vafra str. BVAF]|uniref:D,D-heptose 1,7-bisphosphate phosphatase n=2 Tax=Candidatus Blochmanniella vafra TaxID=251535 RepID=E8Q6U4_BLOVB|nr:D,D-heptose 1,7-bisphosphate phosphatase [Candidatus Blochmannia vafer]ADV33691.1 D,D-heptose 1,7-bisphosphate phosphatase [Candidatus Blochmannia vafer str. BVAF]
MNAKSAIFLDRDGTININNNYISQINNFFFIDNVIKTLLELQDMGFILIIVTNQSGIARGFFTEEQFLYLTKWMISYLKSYFIYIDAVYYCPHHVKGKVKKFKQFCCCRKPNPGMLINAKKYFNINMSKSYIIGDSKYDMFAGKSAQVGTTVLIHNKYNTKIIQELEWGSNPDYVIESLEFLPEIIKYHDNNVI